MKASCKNGFLTAEALKEACERIDVNLNNEQLEYIVTKLFEYSDSINKLSIDRLFEVFSSKPKPLPKEEDFDSRSNLQSEPNVFTASPIIRGSELSNKSDDDEDEDDDEEEGIGEGEEVSGQHLEEADEVDEDEEEEQKIGQYLDASKEGEKKHLRISERREEEEEDSNFHAEEYSENEFNDEERSPQAARDLRLKQAAKDVR